jgi:DNA-binding NtrC family response regulator
MKPKILIVDDEVDIVTILQDRLTSLNYDTVIANDGQRAWDMIEKEAPTLMLLDLEMPRMSGLDVLRRLSQSKQTSVSSSEPNDQGGSAYDFPVVVMTAHGTIAKAVEAMKLGAFDFLSKPIDVDHLSMVVKRALEHESLQRQVECLKTEVEGRYSTIIGTGHTTQAVVEMAKRAAGSDAGVLLLGESGTGKELFARSIHRWSPRSEQPFIVVNCVALTDTLLENELFGHERGAYTGADRLQKGRMELADGGTVFLDEIGDMPITLQAKLLRVLQDHEFQRVGGTRTVRVDIRIIAATNKDLRQAVRTGMFREDLFYRLNVVTLTLPPLRERAEDIPDLAEYFMKRYAREYKRLQIRLSPSAINALTAYQWPGNIRELENTIARAIVLSPTDDITPEVLGLYPSCSTLSAPEEAVDEALDLPYHEALEAYSRRVIQYALKRSHGSQTKAADLLKLQRTYLARMMKQKGISAEEFVG